MFTAITKNLSWKILTKNLVTFKRQDGVKDEKYYGCSLIFRGGGSQKTIYMGNCLKRRAWITCRGLDKKWGGGCF